MDGKIALISGGSRGIGLAIAEALARQGAHVVVTGRDPAHGAQALARLRAITPNASFEAAESGNHAAMSGVVERTVQRAGGLDILVSAGAQGPFGPRPFVAMSQTVSVNGGLSFGGW